jgi:hypothetical protein
MLFRISLAAGVALVILGLALIGWTAYRARHPDACVARETGILSLLIRSCPPPR